jgi:ATP-dependent metalloprotease
VKDNADDEVSLLREYNKRDPEYVIRWYERSRPQQWYNPGILAEYVKALVKTDKLDKSELLSVIQEGV